jgi:hypothetical protein
MFPLHSFGYAFINTIINSRWTFPSKNCSACPWEAQLNLLASIRLLLIKARRYAVRVDIRFEVFTTFAMNNAVFWDVRTQFLPHTKHITAREPSRLMSLRFDVFTAVIWRTPSSGMWSRVAIVRADVSEENIASIIRIERMSELGNSSR